MARKFRTAVLVVHGMGSQRPLETVRGIVDAVWFDKASQNNTGKKRIWTHPEPSGVDIDLTVMTTSALSGALGDRTADFHELYWAHLMSETRAVAVLFWLFELGRKGPRFTTAMNVLWYCIAIFLCLLLLSVSLLMLQAIVWFSQIEDGPQKLVVAPYVMVFIGVVAGIAATWYLGALQLLAELKKAFFRFSAPIVFLISVAIFALIFKARGEEVLYALGVSAAWVTNVLLAPAIALIAAYLLMGKWGLRVFAFAYLLSLCFLLPFFISLVIPEWFHSGSPIQALAKISKAVADGRWPWSLHSQSSEVCAWVIIGVYVIANAVFLQPYLGDAARYFRNSPANIAVRREIRKEAVDTLDMLHRLRIYDRIIVVAHSLGSVVAYDMLRAYYSRICDLIVFDPAQLGKEFTEVDNGAGVLTRDQLRAKGRVIIRRMAENIGDLDALQPPGKPPEAFLVTDFVTLGSPLTHARYLMCDGEDLAELNANFERRLKEREFPSCPPSKHPADPDRWLTFMNSRTKRQTLHHGGLFALTRWTNLYFPMSQLFWGDPVGGPVGFENVGKNKQGLFGEFVCDQEVCLSKAEVKDFFTHTAYWSLKRGDGYNAPHIQDLIKAINLEDTP